MTEIAHAGNLANSLISAFALIPELQFAFTSNANSSSGCALNDGVYKWSLRRYLGIDREPQAPLDQTKEQSGGRVDGIYEMPMFTIEIGHAGGSYEVHARPAQRSPTASVGWLRFMGHIAIDGVTG